MTNETTCTCADYDTALPVDAVLDIRTEYSNARGFRDGDVYRHFRHYQLTGDFVQAGKWKARMTTRKSQYVQHLTAKRRVLCKAFDDLLPFTGIWAPLQLGCFSRILGMKCDEVKQGDFS